MIASLTSTRVKPAPVAPPETTPADDPPQPEVPLPHPLVTPPGISPNEDPAPKPKAWRFYAIPS